MDQRNLPRDGLYCPNRTGRGVNVYVLDTGIWPSHQDFGGRARVAYDAFLPLGHPNYGLDCHGHGTKVASTVGGNASGVARDVNL
ncbi:MAG: S8 family serine peptidase [Pyrinomonadaceae bacterium]